MVYLCLCKWWCQGMPTRGRYGGVAQRHPKCRFEGVVVDIGFILYENLWCNLNAKWYRFLIIQIILKDAVLIFLGWLWRKIHRNRLKTITIENWSFPKLKCFCWINADSRKPILNVWDLKKLVKPWRQKEGVVRIHHWDCLRQAEHKHRMWHCLGVTYKL